VICSYKTSDRVLASDPEALTARSGACNTYYIIPCLAAYLFTCPALQPNLTFSSNPPPPLRIPALHTHSISVLHWLLNAETLHPTSSPPHRLTGEAIPSSWHGPTPADESIDVPHRATALLDRTRLQTSTPSRHRGRLIHTGQPQRQHSEKKEKGLQQYLGVIPVPGTIHGW
jgi:hypothetical protein